MEKMCNENLTQLKEALEERVGKLADVHLEERVAFLASDKKLNKNKLVSEVIRLKRLKQQCSDKKIPKNSFTTQEPCCSHNVSSMTMITTDEEAHVDSPRGYAGPSSSTSSCHSFGHKDNNSDLPLPVG